MREKKILHHLNCIKMCQSDKAIMKRIETIFSEGNSNGWTESGQCPKCLKNLNEEPKFCSECLETKNDN